MLLQWLCDKSVAFTEPCSKPVSDPSSLHILVFRWVILNNFLCWWLCRWQLWCWWPVYAFSTRKTWDIDISASADLESDKNSHVSVQWQTLRKYSWNSSSYRLFFHWAHDDVCFIIPFHTATEKFLPGSHPHPQNPGNPLKHKLPSLK